MDGTPTDEPPQGATTPPVDEDLTPWMPIDGPTHERTMPTSESAAASAASATSTTAASGFAESPPTSPPTSPFADAPVRVQLPPPPPDPYEVAMVRPVPQPGETTPAWRVVFCVGWIGVILMLIAVWKSGRTLGLAPWWLGPSGDPHGLLINLIPFVPPVAMIVMTARGDRHLPWAGIVASLALGGVAAGDLGRFSGIGLVELAAAAAGLLVSLASFAGVYRRVTDADDPDPDAPESVEDLVGTPSTTAL